MKLNAEATTATLSTALAEFQHVLREPTLGLEALRMLGDPLWIDFLFSLELSLLVRMGPKPTAQLTPPRLVAVAQAAAAVGIAPAATPAAMRRTLARLAGLIRSVGAWHPEEPLWWEPLPPPGLYEKLWEALADRDRGPIRPPSIEELTAAFAEDGAPRWLELPALIEPAFAAQLHRELTAARRAGLLTLERAGVGAAGEVSARRSDVVCYLAGTEPELLDVAPATAVFLQNLLHTFAVRLGRAVPEVAAFPPQKVMVACYPAPSAGYAPHLDNPGGERDNGRGLTLVLYVNAPGEECAGGELALWSPGTRTSEPPALTLSARGGAAVLFDARAVPHQVKPLAPGPERWAVTVWLNDRPPPQQSVFPLPEISLAEVLMPITSPPLPAKSVLFHELTDDAANGTFTVRTAAAADLRVGVVATVYRAGRDLDAWCAHHFDLGADHAVLIFDHLDDPAEAADAARLREQYPAERLTVWSGDEIAAERWPALADHPQLADLQRYAGCGGSSYAVASRQTLNASAALAAARTDELGGAPLAWLLHLDADELLYLEGSGRGGASLAEHFAAVSAAGLELVRYVNHELLSSPLADGAPRFKVNPRIAAARLGRTGWKRMVEHLKMAQIDPRPYFHGYFNGKAAVSVPVAAAAAGVHGWFLRRGGTETPASRFLAGPSVLHFHFADRDAFRRKYLAVADADPPPGPGLFEPSPAEESAVETIRALRRKGASRDELERRLDALHDTLTRFRDEEVELLNEAKLILSPRLRHPLRGGGTS